MLGKSSVITLDTKLLFSLTIVIQLVFSFFDIFYLSSINVCFENILGYDLLYEINNKIGLHHMYGKVIQTI